MTYLSCVREETYGRAADWKDFSNPMLPIPPLAGCLETCLVIMSNPTASEAFQQPNCAEGKSCR